MVFCDNCGKEVGDKQFCPFCGTDINEDEKATTGIMPAVTPAPPVSKAPPAPLAPPVLSGTGTPAGPPVKKKKSPAFWVALCLIVVLVVAAAVVIPLLLLQGNSTTVITVLSPEPGEKISDRDFSAAVSFGGNTNVKEVVFKVDGDEVASDDSPPFRADIETGDKGSHTLKITAFDGQGKALASRSVEYTSAYEPAGTEGDDGENKTQDEAYKKQVSDKTAQVTALNAEIKNMADRINTALSTGITDAFMQEVRALYNKASALYDSANALKAPSGYEEVQKNLLVLCEQLKQRADALVKGCEAERDGRGYEVYFNEGAKAKALYDATWPVFVNACRSKGISVPGA